MTECNSKVIWRKVEDIGSYESVARELWSALDEAEGSIQLDPGAEVMIKVNLCLLKGPETGATVDPRVAKALVEWLLKNYDLKTIYIAEADATHLGADMAFQVLGWKDMFGGMRAVKLFNLSEDKTVLVGGRYIKDLKMSKKMMGADCLVSLGKLKTHTQQKITGIMKNQFGAIPYKYKIVYHPRLAQAIFDATAARPPELSVVDGLIAMEGNGPTNGVPRRSKLLLVSDDPVKMDYTCAGLMGFRPMTVPHIKLAAQQGFLNKGLPSNPGIPAGPRFKFLPKWKEIAKKGIGLLQREAINEEA
jgi:uncharacterized protein (DUF362 family)